MLDKIGVHVYNSRQMNVLRTENEYKILRKKLHMTQKELAETLGIDVMTVSAWERGVQKPNQVMSRALLSLVAAKV